MLVKFSTLANGVFIEDNGTDERKPSDRCFRFDANGRRVFAMEISPAYIDVAVERWQADTGREAILDGDGRTFAAVKGERLGGEAEAPAETPEANADNESTRKRKSAA